MLYTWRINVFPVTVCCLWSWLALSPWLFHDGRIWEFCTTHIYIFKTLSHPLQHLFSLPSTCLESFALNVFLTFTKAISKMSSVSQSPLFLTLKTAFWLLSLPLCPFQSVLLGSFISFKHLITTHGNCSWAWHLFLSFSCACCVFWSVSVPVCMYLSLCLYLWHTVFFLFIPSTLLSSRVCSPGYIIHIR